MFENNLLLFIMHEEPLLTQRRIIAGMASECNPGGPVVIAVYKNDQYDIKILPSKSSLRKSTFSISTSRDETAPKTLNLGDEVRAVDELSMSRKQLIATYENQLISADELIALVYLIRSTYRTNKLTLCCHADLAHPYSNQVTLEAHKMVEKLTPNHLILIASSLTQCFSDSGIYAAGKPSCSNLTLSSAVKSAVVFTRMNLIQKIKEEQKKPTWIRSRTTGYSCFYYFSCFFSGKKSSVDLDALDDDENGDDHLIRISEHPDNISQCHFDGIFIRDRK